MITCPNCGKEVSEDSVHCGHCGHRLKTGQRKTMMGLGPIDASWKEKLEAARSASEDSATSQEGTGEAGREVVGSADRDEPTEVMETIDLGSKDEGGASEEDDLDEAAFARTAAMDSVSFEEMQGTGLFMPKRDDEGLEPTEPHQPVVFEQNGDETPGMKGVNLPAGGPDRFDRWKNGAAAHGSEGDGFPNTEEAADPFPPNEEPEGSGVGGASSSFTRGGGNPGFGPVAVGPEVGGEGVSAGDDGRKRLVLVLGIVGGLILLFLGTLAVGFFLAGDSVQEIMGESEAGVDAAQGIDPAAEP